MTKVCRLVYYQLMVRIFENVNNTKKVALHNAREGWLNLLGISSTN